MWTLPLTLSSSIYTLGLINGVYPWFVAEAYVALELSLVCFSFIWFFLNQVNEIFNNLVDLHYFLESQKSYCN